MSDAELEALIAGFLDRIVAVERRSNQQFELSAGDYHSLHAKALARLGPTRRASVRMKTSPGEGGRAET